MSDPDRQVWGGVLAHLRSNHAAVYRRWFEEQLDALGVIAGQFVLRAHSEVHRDYLRRACQESFNDSLGTVTGRLLSVRFLGPGEPVEVPPQPVAAPSKAPAETLAINPDFGFSVFVVGPTNRLAHAAAVAVADAPGKHYNPLFLHGGVGLGKTHLLQAICLAIRERDPSAQVCYLSCESFVSEFVEAVQQGHMSEFRHRFRGVDVLVIDDIHYLGARDRSQEEFFHTFNSLYQAGKQIVLSSDAPPHLIPDLEARLVSRFKWGLVACVEKPCFDTRVAILKTKARLRGIELPEGVACHIATVVDSNIRELEGAIVGLQIRAGVENRSITLDMAIETVGNARERAPERQATIQTIIEAVTEFYGIRVADLQSKKRARSVTLPRQICMFLARRCTRHSLEEIGGYFGGRDHTTVMHAVKAVEAKSEKDPKLGTELKVLEERLRPPQARAS